MSSRQPGDRFSQMSEQASIVARKKAEIEAKLKTVQHGGSQLHNASNLSPSSSGVSKTGQINAKNRWGFKGKRPVEESAGPSAVKNTFTNDGSFFEQFKKMQQAQIKVEEPGPPAKKPLISTEEKPKQADDWYKAALERARSIAQTFSKPEASGVVKKEEPEPSAGIVVSPPESSVDIVKKDPGDEEVADDELSTVANELASMVAVIGDQVEQVARARNVGEDELAFLYDPSGHEYKAYRRKVESLRRGVIAESTSRKEDACEANSGEGGKSKRKSRWGEEGVKLEQPPQPSMMPQSSGSDPRKNNPQLAQYAMRVYGTTDLDDSKWKQCEDQLKMSMVYQDILAKQKEAQILAQKGHHKYEYDSDEDTEGGTWEHKARKLEMEKTQAEASKLTRQAQGKHHIGDFLPPDQLAKFMAKYEAIKSGEEFVDESDYSEHKLTDENLGFKMLQRMGWNEGKGLGSEGQGITTPVGKSQQGGDKIGLGTAVSHSLDRDDDEFDAYRKRMMLAYRFRPNPLNNPRRSYY